MNKGVQQMLDDIYTSGSPVGFDQIDVSARVTAQFPAGMGRAEVERVFQTTSSSRIVDSSPALLVVRDIRGKPMVEPDARTVLMEFLFDASGNLRSSKALHMRRQ